jgi:hypothetical protein
MNVSFETKQRQGQSYYVLRTDVMWFIDQYSIIDTLNRWCIENIGLQRFRCNQGEFTFVDDTDVVRFRLTWDGVDVLPTAKPEGGYIIAVRKDGRRQTFGS